MTLAAAPASGWYLDPYDSTLYRWWDGTQWTEHVMSPHSESHLQLVSSTPPATELVASVPVVAEPAAVEPVIEAQTPMLVNAPISTGVAPISSGVPTRTKVLVALLLVTAVGAGLFWWSGRTTSSPAIQPQAPTQPTASSTSPGADVPKSVDRHMGNAVSKAQDTAANVASAQKQQDDALANLTADT